MRTAWFSEYSVDSFWRWPPQKAPKLPARPCAPPDYWSNGEGLQADDGVLENTQGASSYTSYEFQAWGWKYWKTHKVVIMIMSKPSWSSCRDENYSDWVCWVPHYEWGWMWHNHDVEYGPVKAQVLGNWSYLEVPDQVLGMFIGSWPTVQLQDFKMAKDLFSRSSEAVVVIWTDFIFNCYKESIPKKK